MFNSKTLRLTALSLLAATATASHAELIYGISNATASSLLSFDSANPAGFTAGPALTGIVSGQTIRAIDFRPANGTLYALSSSGAAAQLYSVNLTTGALTTVGAGFTITGNTSTTVSMDFNPVVDRLRIVTGSGNNLRVNPNDGTIAATDTNIANSAGATQTIADVAYSNNVVGATSTTLYAYNYSADTLDTIGSVGGTPTSPNSGQLFTVGSSGKVSFASAALGFDISGATGLGYVAFDDSASASGNQEFYSVNLGTGALTQIGANEPFSLRDFSVAPVPEPATIAALGLGALAMVRRRRKA